MDKEIISLRNLMNEKGYRDTFRVVPDLYHNGTGKEYPLQESLKTWLSEEIKEGGLRRPLFLSYEFYSPNHGNTIDIRFHLVFGGDSKIRVPELRISLGRNEQYQHIRLSSTHHVPALLLLPNYFDQRKPGEDPRRGQLPRH